MTIMRVSILTPQPGNETAVANLLNALDGVFAQEDGYVLGLQFTGLEGSQELGRIFVWDNQETADKAGTSTEARSILERITQLSAGEPTETIYQLQGYALKPR